MYLDYAEDQAMRRRPMHMTDWITKLDASLEFNERNVLTHAPGRAASEGNGPGQKCSHGFPRAEARGAGNVTASRAASRTACGR
jgi:hypothetical protein